MPPPPRNHRTPTTPDTPASAAASMLVAPLAIAAQNRWRCSRRPTGGRPGERIAGRPARSDTQPFGLPIATLLDQALQRPLESALAAVIGVVDQPGLRAPARERHLQRVDHERRAHLCGHRPAEA